MGNLLRHGIDAYNKTINLDNEIKVLEQTRPENIKNKKHTHKPKIPGEFLKTDLPAKNVNQGFLQGSLLKETIPEQPESKYRRVAKFLILIGSEQAAEILAELDPEQVNEISKEIALTKIIKPEEKDEIFKEFHLLFSKPYSLSGSSRGGIETARRILYAAKGPEKGEALLNKAVPESRENLFSFLEEFSPEQIVMILKTETDQTAALILSRLSSKLSAGTISKLPAKQKAEILKRMAHQREISPEILEQVSAALKEKVRNIAGSANSIEINGMQTLAAILKQGDYSFGDRIINELEKENPEVGKNLKDKLYTLDDVINTIDRSVQEKLSTMTEREIAVLLKSRKQEFCEKILSCVSAGRRQIIREESEILGAVSKSDCDAAANEFLAWFRKARENGEIILESDKDVFI
ncbi:MAG: flagellar motor switch protein FliG [Treponema sp.]|jgi:flagellar motor switch protein FliG|nr:flagellar motor switch protein FliG [Treponema sp.]